MPLAIKRKDKSTKQGRVEALCQAESINKRTVKQQRGALKDIKEVSLRIAEAVAQQAVEEGVTEGRDSTPLKERLEAHFWTPAYACYG